MKKEELMVGDWVYNTHNRQNERVAEIGTGLVMLDCNDLYEYDEIEPIRINDDILSLNGWERTGGASHRIYGDYNAVIFHWNENRKEIIIDKNGDRHYMLKLDLLYVHELQHALRICGIDTKIKVKQVEL